MEVQTAWIYIKNPNTISNAGTKGIFEVGIHQSDQVAALIDELIVQCPDSPLQNGRIEIHNDIQDIPRVVQIF